MSAKPIGVYVRVSDIRKAVSDAPDVSQKIKDLIINLMDQSCGKEELVDVILMAECLWRWQYDLTRGCANPIRSAEFKIIMDRVKNSKIVPTVATFAKSGPI